MGGGKADPWVNGRRMRTEEVTEGEAAKEDTRRI